MHKFTLTCCALLCVALAFGQELVKRGDKAMGAYKFAKAASIYKKAVDADPKNIVALEKLGNALRLSGDYQSAEAIYKLLMANPLTTPLSKFYYGQVLVVNGKYTEADSVFTAFADASPKDQRSEEFRNFAKKLAPLLQDNHTWELTSAPENTEASEMSPAYWVGQLTFTSNRGESAGVKQTDMRSGRGYYDVFVVGKQDSGNNVPGKMKGKINSRFNDGPATFSTDGKEAIFTRTYKKKGPDGYRKLWLYRADWDAKKGWVNVQPLPFNSNTFNTAHPSLSKDGRKLYFVSDMPGGLGETDVYVSVRNGATWEAPVNLGKEINTPGTEMFPFIADDGTLYYASDCKVGLGGLDIYAATASGNKFGSVYNLGIPVNTSADDFGLATDETVRAGFFTSNRDGGVGGDDLYHFLKKTESICGTVADAKTKAVISGANVVAIDAYGSKTEASTNTKGTFCLQLAPGKQYMLETTRDGFGADTLQLDVKALHNDVLAINLNPKGDIPLSISINQKDDGKIEGATAFLINKATGEVQQAKSDSNGMVKFDLYRDQQYDLKVVKKLPGNDGVYDKFVKTISTMGFTPSQTLNENAQLTYYDSKYVFDLPLVYFDLNSYAINASATKGLNKVVEVMKLFPDMQVELSAHTDSRGKEQYNLELSARRANACVEYLAAQGIDKTRLIAIGYGELKIRNKCVNEVPCTEKEHMINRRTEFRVVKFD